MTDALLPPEPEAIVVAPGVRIPVAEVELRGITGGGPGGQHVNRSATRVALRWNLRATRALSAEQRTRLVEKLGSRLDADGTLRIVAGEYRSQLQNRRAAIERLVALLARALVVQPKRKATRPTHGSIERRLDAKRQRSDTKRGRRFDADD
ncbi:MAG TPA: alternative ribosome rescue aminoacyl-tRNA hydrolase ArfB [Gemmatimonas sp.]|nr:alternative ribosome rescue aminoacyl-tRNA hydrolase ArfB [Gemmatimonas sp.]